MAVKSAAWPIHHNDVALLEKTLKVLGFEVTTVRDAGLAELAPGRQRLTRRVQKAGSNAVGFFYYSGHGAADGGTNYLIPIDVKTTETGELWDQSLRLTEITRKLKTEAGMPHTSSSSTLAVTTLKLTSPGSRSLVQSKGFVPVTQRKWHVGLPTPRQKVSLPQTWAPVLGPYASLRQKQVRRLWRENS